MPLVSFTLREVSAMLGLSSSRIRAYATKGFLVPERGDRGELRFGFQDLVILRTAGELTAANIPQRKVRRVLEKLREQLPAGRSLTGVRISADGERVVVREGETVWNPESGQSLFDFSVDELTANTAPIVRGTERDADDWYDLACEVESTDPAAAKHAYEQAIALDPTHADAHVNLGRLLHELGAPAAAEPHYRAAIAAVPEHDTAAFNLGVALEDLGRPHDAIEAYERALSLDADNADAHYNLAGLYERGGDKASALRHLREYKNLRE
jgi:tetratricopeptide (TPR) repeat protein